MLTKKDAPTVDALYSYCADDVKRRIYFMVSSSHNAAIEVEDLSQETWIKVHRFYARVPDDWNVRSWVLRVAQNLTIDYLRKARSRKFEEVEIINDLDSDGMLVEDPADALIRRDSIHAIYAQLTTVEMTAVHLHANGFSNRDIQRYMGRPENSGMKMTVSRSRRKFKRLYDEAAQVGD